MGQHRTARVGSKLMEKRFVCSSATAKTKACPSGAGRKCSTVDAGAVTGAGSLVIYREADGAALWSSGTFGRAPGRFCMRTDGNLVIYGPDGAAQWSSGTVHPDNANSELVLQTDGKAQHQQQPNRPGRLDEAVR